MHEENIIETTRRIISELLAISPAAIEITTDLFDLGFDSLTALQLVARIRSELEVELSIRDLYTSPCIEGIVAAINRRQTALR